MILLKPKKNFERWAYVVIDNYTSGTPLSEDYLVEQTDKFIQCHAKRLYDSIHKILNASKQETKDKHYEKACFEYGVLVDVKKYANKPQKYAINRAIDDFIAAENCYLHPNIKTTDALSQKKRNKEEFWEGVAIVEMIELFSNDLFKKK
ncbi:MAG: hypothetical protein Q4B60_09170 [Erysipelotrichaceae bacterium]|nr:hypothetical protein [Erysipelotrichaceae bacterium]